MQRDNIIIAAVLFILSIPAVCFPAYTPPIGIPAPPFGIDEVTPVTDGSGNNTWCPNWPSAANTSPHACYYIDNSVACNDSNASGYGRPGSPRCTIPSLTNAAAGTFIDVHGGTTTAYGEVRINGVGTSSSPIVVTGKNAAVKPKIEYTFTVGYNGSVEYFIVENLDFRFIHGVDYSDGLLGRSMATNATMKSLVFRNNYVECTGSAGDRGALVIKKDPEYSGLVPEYSVIYNNEQRNCGNWESQAETDQDGGIAIMGNHSWVLDNTVYRSGVDGVSGGHGAMRTLTNYYIGRNTLIQNRENCVDVKEINKVVISENICYGQRPHGEGGDISPGEGIVVHYGPNTGYGPDEVWVLFNTIYDSGYGMYINSTGGKAYVIGNVIYDIHQRLYNGNYYGGVGILFYDMKGTYVIDNTLYDYDNGFSRGAGSGGAEDTYVIHGNIFSNRATSGGIDVESYGDANYITADHNLIYKGAQSTVQIQWGGTAYTTVKAWTACTSCVEGDPLFSNAPTSFTLTSSSPAKDVSTLSDVYATFYSTYGVSILKDRAGTARPQNSLWDIGAYEYTAGGDTTPPTLSSLTPSGTVGYGATKQLSVTTDEAATCRYHATETTWANMTEMSSTGGTTHTQTVSVSVGSNSFKGVCRDAVPNESSAGTWSFTVEAYVPAMSTSATGATLSGGMTIR